MITKGIWMGKCKIFWTEDAIQKLQDAGRMYFKSLPDEKLIEIFSIILKDDNKTNTDTDTDK